MPPMKNRRMPRLGRVGLAVVGLATVAVAAPLAGWMTSTPIGAHWSQVVDDTLTDLPQPLKVLQLVYAYLAIPALVLAFAVLCWLTYRRSWRAALTYAAVLLLTNLSVQFVKLAPLGLKPSSTSLDPLSGHVGVAAGVVLGWLLVAPVRRHLRSEVLSALVLVAVTSGVMLAGWHSPFQVLCPLLFGMGWSLVGAAVLARGAAAAPTLRARTWRDIAAIVSGAVVVGISTAVLLANAATFPHIGAGPVVLAVCWTTGWCAVAVGVVDLASTRIPDPSAVAPLGTVSPATADARRTT